MKEQMQMMHPWKEQQSTLASAMKPGGDSCSQACWGRTLKLGPWAKASQVQRYRGSVLVFHTCRGVITVFLAHVEGLTPSHVACRGHHS